jgi:hypothetical protein
MPEKSEIIIDRATHTTTGVTKPTVPRHARGLLEVAIVFGLILAAVWTPQGRLNAVFTISVAVCVTAFAVRGPWSSREMGLARPLVAAGRILFIGSTLCGVIGCAGLTLRFAGAGYAIPWTRSWEYAIWALVQEVILQSIFFLRLESVIGSRHAVLWAASLYAIAHVPSPVLTVLSFLGGLMFCELFRRYRNIFPLGVIHAALGLTIAASLPDKWLHHMRVGIGYLRLH